MAERAEIFTDIETERIRQDKLWGEQWRPGKTDPLMKSAILTEEVGEVAKEVLEGGEKYESLRLELIQVAAVAVAFLESLPDTKA